ncbi:MAG: RidA family protein [Bryobacteraceae bacterium]|jgi:enamine deaminase RidA (YjgF/YER057c/UK114 family)
MYANWIAGAALAAGLACVVWAQQGLPVKRISPPADAGNRSRFSSVIWAGDTLYMAGQMASPATPADPARGKPAVYGDTKTQTLSVLTKIQSLLKEQGLTMGDVVQMHVFMAGDPAKGGKLDFDGMNEAYDQFFGTPQQPNKPVRAAMQVAALVQPWGLVEIEVTAVRSRR